MARAWEDGPYLFIVKVQPILRRGEDVEDPTFSFTSEEPSSLTHGDVPIPCSFPIPELEYRPLRSIYTDAASSVVTSDSTDSY